MGGYRNGTRCRQLLAVKLTFGHHISWYGVGTCMLGLMFRFHGMPFVDLAHLRKSDLKDGYLTLRRRKTGMPLSARVDSRAMQLLERYRNRDKAY